MVALENMGRRFSMNPGKGLRVGVMLAAVCAWPSRILAEPLRIESLLVPLNPSWQRGPSEQEQADEVYLLDQRADQAVASQVVLLRRAPLIKGDADGYYDKLTRYWRATYGKAVLIDWVEAGGVKWRYLRRPSSENGMGVFQLSTVFDGRAYSLLVFVPGTVTTLPVPVMTLLENMRLGSRSTEISPPDIENTAPSPALRWVRTRTYRFNLSGEALEAVVMADVDRLDQDGMLTGYGLDYGESSVDWFMEGFEWKTLAGRVTRVPWATRGRLEVVAPQEFGEGGAWTLRLILPEEEAGVSARLVVWDLCGSPEAMKDALERLNRGARGPMERLAAEKSTGCHSPIQAEPAHILKGEPGKTSTAVWILPGSPTILPAGDGKESSKMMKRVRLVETVLEPGAARTVPGNGLLQRARLFFAYEP